MAPRERTRAAAGNSMRYKIVISSLLLLASSLQFLAQDEIEIVNSKDSFDPFAIENYILESSKMGIELNCTIPSSKGSYVFDATIPVDTIVLEYTPPNQKSNQGRLEIVGKRARYHFLANISPDHNPIVGDTIRTYLDSLRLFEEIIPININNQIVYAKNVYFRDGKIKSKFTLIPNTDLFLAEEFYNSGQIKSRRFLKHDTSTLVHLVQVDSSIEWYANGQLQSYHVFMQGKQPMKAWFSDGSLSRTGVFIDFPFFWVGELIDYYQNGNIRCVKTFSDGNLREQANIKNGDWKWYDEKGNVLRWEQYKDGSLVRIIKDGIVEQ